MLPEKMEYTYDDKLLTGYNLQTVSTVKICSKLFSGSALLICKSYLTVFLIDSDHNMVNNMMKIPTNHDQVTVFGKNDGMTR